MNQRILLATAFFIAACAGYFSVTGIGQLFSGAAISAIAMASALELGKLVTVSFVYRYWSHISRALRWYYVTASVVLMLITSVGIYGYLTAAYASASTGVRDTERQVAVIERRQESLDKSIASLNAQLQQSTDIARQQEDRLDKLVGRNGFAAQQRVVQQQNARITTLQNQVTALTNTRDSLDQVKAQTATTITSTSKIGTFYYVAKMLNVELDTVIRWFVLAIVLVFDPLSVTLILAYNIARRANETSPQPINEANSPIIDSEPPVSEDVTPPEIPEPAPTTEPEWVSIDGLTEAERLERLRTGIRIR